jgi:hypothetical protein
MGGHVLMWRAVFILAVGCGRHINPEWCALHSDPACDVTDAMDAMIDAPPADCDCPGTACLPGGGCAEEDTILYTSPTGGGSACTSDARCLLVTAIGLAAPGRDIIVLEPKTYPGGIVINQSMHIIGLGAILEAAVSGPAIAVKKGVTAELDYLSITGSGAGSGIACKDGILVARRVRITGHGQGITSACTLTLEGSVVASNTGGALEITSGAIDIRNNFIVNNGDDKLMRVSNVSIADGVTGTFAFNTVAYNDAKQNTSPGVNCQSAAVTGEGNIVTDNTQRGAFHVNPQVVGTCDFTRSYTEDGAGENDLRWVNVLASDFHLTAESTAVLDTTAVTCDDTVDIDGETRPEGGRCDFGADELSPAR